MDLDALKNAATNFVQQQQQHGGQGATAPADPNAANAEHKTGGGGGGFNFNNLGDSINGALGGGKNSEANEDYLDKAVDFVQEKLLGAGAQDNESAAEQFKDEQISDAIRDAYKKQTGSDFPIADKQH